MIKTDDSKAIAWYVDQTKLTVVPVYNTSELSKLLREQKTIHGGEFAAKCEAARLKNYQDKCTS